MERRLANMAKHPNSSSRYSICPATDPNMHPLPCTGQWRLLLRVSLSLIFPKRRPTKHSRRSQISSWQSSQTTSWVMPFQINSALGKLENIFRVIFGFPTKSTAFLKDIPPCRAFQTSNREKAFRTDCLASSMVCYSFPQLHVPIFSDERHQFHRYDLMLGKVVDMPP